MAVTNYKKRNYKIKIHKQRIMYEQARIHHESFESLLKSLSAYSNVGVKLMLGDITATPREIAFRCLEKPDSAYMTDFVHGENGILREIHFNLI